MAQRASEAPKNRAHANDLNVAQSHRMTADRSMRNEWAVALIRAHRTPAVTFDNLRSFVGVFLILGVVWLLSANRKDTPFRSIGLALALQLTVGVLVFALPPLRQALSGVTYIVKALQAATGEGVTFLFGYLGGAPTPYEEAYPENGFLLAFQVLPLILVISTLAALFWRWGILSRVCRGLGYIFERTLGLSGPVGLATSASIFLGMIEAPMIVRPYLAKMSRSDIFLIMTTAMSTIAGTMMALYIAMMERTVPEAAAHVFVASFMAAPGSVAIARLMFPAAAEAGRDAHKPPPKLYTSTMDAFSRGVQDGINIYISVIGMILVSVALIALINGGLGALVPELDGAPLSFERILGWVFAPVMYLLGVPWREAADAGVLLGTKVVLNELLAFIQLSTMEEGALSARTRVMMIYVLCGFANFSAAAIMIGGMSAMCPDRRPDFLDLGLKSVFSGSMTNLLNAALIGAAPAALTGLYA